MSELGRVLHIVPAAPFGGAQRLVVDLAAEQAGSGWAPEIIFTTSAVATAVQSMQAAKNAGVAASVVSGRTWFMLRRLRQIMSASDLKIVHLHVPSPWMLGLVKRSQSAALIAHLHVRPALMVHKATVRRIVHDFLTRLLMRRCDRLIAISTWIADAWREADPHLDPRLVYNGIPMPEPVTRSMPDRPFTLGMASRLSDHKGVEEFIKLAAALHASAPEIRFSIAGEGPLRESYEAQAEALELSDALTFEGFVEDMAKYWGRLDVAAFTPPFEPFGLRLIEPLAHGIPVVAYRTNTGADEVIGRCRGITAVPYGETERLAQKVIELRDDSQQRESLADAGYSDVHKLFSIQAMAAGVSEIYTQVLATRRVGLLA